MKSKLLLFVTLICLKSFAQTYPYAEGFEGQPSNQPPTGWTGSMKVLLNHGLNDFKAISARVSSGVTVDSGITPLIGPLTSSSVFSFYYRIIDQANYPSTPTNLDNDSKVEIMLSTDSVNYQTVYLIDMNNHNPSFNFVKRKVFLSQFSSDVVHFKIRCQYGTGASFFVDVDTINVKDDTQSSIAEIGDDVSFVLYPNPCNLKEAANLKFTDSKQYMVRVFNSLGQQVFYSPAANSCQLPSGNWPAGIYFVQACNLCRKLIIE